MKINADTAVRVTLNTADLPWVASPMPGVERKMLERDGEEVAKATSGRTKLDRATENLIAFNANGAGAAGAAAAQGDAKAGETKSSWWPF